MMEIIKAILWAVPIAILAGAILWAIAQEDQKDTDRDKLVDKIGKTLGDLEDRKLRDRDLFYDNPRKNLRKVKKDLSNDQKKILD
jgi:hypothetical protein